MKREVLLPLFTAVAVFMLFSPASSQARTVQMNAQASANSSPPTRVKGQREAMRMVPAQAVLKNKIDARKMRAGNRFQATLNGTVQLKNGPKLPSGTELIGRVAHDKMQADGASTLALRFTRARLKSGEMVPIKATIVDVSPPEDFDFLGSSHPAFNDWNDKTLKVDQLNAESGVNLHSAIANRNSGVFVTTKEDNVKLPAGAQLSLAIAARNSVRPHKMALSHSKGSAS